MRIPKIKPEKLHDAKSSLPQHQHLHLDTEAATLTVIAEDRVRIYRDIEVDPRDVGGPIAISAWKAAVKAKATELIATDTHIHFEDAKTGEDVTLERRDPNKEVPSVQTLVTAKDNAAASFTFDRKELIAHLQSDERGKTVTFSVPYYHDGTVSIHFDQSSGIVCTKG